MVLTFLRIYINNELFTAYYQNLAEIEAMNKLLLFVLVVMIVGGGSYLGYRYLSFIGKTNIIPAFSQPLPKPFPTASTSPTPTPTPKPTPRPIPHGKIPFKVGMALSVWPKMTEGFLDPYDPSFLQQQTVSIKVNDTKPVTSVTATLKTDNSSNTVTLRLVEGTNLDGRWEGSWRVSDSYLYNYNLILTGESGSGKSSVDITLR